MMLIGSGPHISWRASEKPLRIDLLRSEKLLAHRCTCNDHDSDGFFVPEYPLSAGPAVSMGLGLNPGDNWMEAWNPGVSVPLL